MTPELEEYFNNYNELFNHAGFKQLIEELANNARQLADLQTVKDQEELFYRKGQVAALATVINLEGTITAARDQAEAEATRRVRCIKYMTFAVIAVVYLKRWYAVERQSVGATVA